MIRVLILCVALAACGQEKAPERPTAKSNARLDSIEARLDAAEAADPTLPETSEGPDAEAPDPPIDPAG